MICLTFIICMYEQKNSQNYGVMQRMQHILEALTAANSFFINEINKNKIQSKANGHKFEKPTEGSTINTQYRY